MKVEEVARLVEIATASPELLAMRLGTDLRTAVEWQHRAVQALAGEVLLSECDMRTGH